eukprot:9415711-Prorocentrum_lima.AAC.1
MTSSLVGSEMCIRDSEKTIDLAAHTIAALHRTINTPHTTHHPQSSGNMPVSYTHLTLPTICSV